MLLPPITLKQKEILFLLYRFRFLTRTHIQLFLNHKNPNQINAWLTDLVNKGYLQRIYSRTIGEINKPAIYYLDLKGRLELKNNKECNLKALNKIYREKDRKESFIYQCLTTADIRPPFLKRSKETKRTLYFYTPTDLILHTYLKELKPHAYVALEKKGQETKRFFIEIIDEKESRKSMSFRIQEYINFCDEGEWEDNTKFEFPTVLFVCPNLGKKVYLIYHMEDDENDVNFYFLTKEEILSTGIDKIF